MEKKKTLKNTKQQLTIQCLKHIKKRGTREKEETQQKRGKNPKATMSHSWQLKK